MPILLKPKFYVQSQKYAQINLEYLIHHFIFRNIGIIFLTKCCNIKVRIIGRNMLPSIRDQDQQMQGQQLNNDLRLLNSDCINDFN